MSPKVSIGIPTYNRPNLLAGVLENFRAQTFSDFELIISDNASPDPDVAKLCEDAVRADGRFRYIRHSENRGPEANFWFVYDQCCAPLFLWAADDDVWPLDFLEKGVAALEQYADASVWCCHTTNINDVGMQVRNYPSYSRFNSTPWKTLDLARYLWEPEIMGKGNLIYSMFRREALRDVIDVLRELPETWGKDMSLVYGVLCRCNAIVDDRTVLRKRVLSDGDREIAVPRRFIYPWNEREVYFELYREVARGTKYEKLTSLVLTFRFLYDWCFHRLVRLALKARLGFRI